MRAILGRDLRHELFDRRFFRLRSLVAGMGAGALALASLLARRIDPDRVGTVFLAFSGGAGLLALLAVIPAVGAHGILRDRLTGTLEVLRTCPVSPLRIVIASWLARLAIAGLLASVALPFLALSCTFGGILPEHAMALAVVIFVAAAAAVSVTLAASWGAREPASALPIAYGSLAAVVGLGAFADALRGSLASSALASWILERASVLSPWSRIDAVIAQARNAESGWPTWLPEYLGDHAFLTVLALVLATAAVRRGTTRATPKRVPFTLRLRSLERLLERRPLLWLGFATHSRRRLGLLSILLLAPVAAMEVRVALRVHGGALPEDLIAPVTLLTGLAMLVAAAAGALARQREVRRGAVDVLHASPATNAEIALGLHLGAVLTSAPFLVLALLHAIAATLVYPHRGPWIIVWLPAALIAVADIGGRAFTYGGTEATPGRALATAAIGVGLSSLRQLGWLFAPFVLAVGALGEFKVWWPIVVVFAFHRLIWPFAVLVAATNVSWTFVDAAFLLLPLLWHVAVLRHFLQWDLPLGYVGRIRRLENFRTQRRRMRRGRPGGERVVFGHYQATRPEAESAGFIERRRRRRASELEKPKPSRGGR